MCPEFSAKQTLSGPAWDKKIPLNPITVANNLGISVYFDSSLGNLSGYYNAEQKAIYVNANDSLLRKRFTIAHELGHHVMMHGSSPRDSSQYYNTSNYVIKEHEANRFAAELLMPEEVVRFMIDSRGMTFDQLTNEFGVSDQAMRIRLRALGYI